MDWFLLLYSPGCYSVVEYNKGINWFISLSGAVDRKQSILSSNES